MTRNDDQQLTSALSGLGERISKIADLVGGKKTLAKAIGISESQLYRYISGDSQPTVDPLAAIARSGNVHMDWLVLGEGPTGLIQDINETRGLYSAQPEYVSVVEYHDESRPLDNPPVSALGKFSFSYTWLVKNGLNPDTLRLIRAHGDSMAPTISEGDLLMIDISQTAFNGEAVYLLRIDERALTAKRLQYAVEKGLYLVSDNPAYREQHIPDERKDSLNIIGKVVWSAGLV